MHPRLCALLRAPAYGVADAKWGACRSGPVSGTSLPAASWLGDRWCSSPVGAYPYLMRLVSLLPSATEIVYALGLGEDLVGVTVECDEPPAARSGKAIVVGGPGTPGMTPREIGS